MKWLLVVAVIAGCLAHLDASRIIRRDSSGERGGTALTGFFATNVGSNGIDGALGAAGETIGGVGGNTGGMDDGGDTPDDGDSPDGNSPGAAAAGGGGNEVGDTPDGVDTPDFDSTNQRSGLGRPVVNDNGATGVDDVGEQASDPGQIVGASGSAGTTAGIVIGVVALVGVVAGVAIYAIKKRN